MLRKKKVKCSIANCENTTFNSPHLQFYRFPTSNPLFPLKSERRKIWLTAVRRQGPDKSSWQPTENQRICGEHFVGAKKSEDPRSRSYNPTIFPDIPNSNKVVLPQTGSLDREVQVDFLEDNVNRRDVFICNRLVYLSKCDAETQAYRPRGIKLEVQTAEEIEIKVEDLHHCIDIKEEPSVLEYQSEPNEKSFTCDFCGYEFTCSHHLKMHLRIHTGEKPFACAFCDFKSARAETLKIHVRTHTGEKPFTCEICDYKSAHQDTFKRYSRAHSGEKPFTCNYCNYKCARKEHLKIHVRTHTGEEPFTCEFCDYKSALKINLNKHLKIHTDIL